jgi:di/tricarboxylate transporter
MDIAFLAQTGGEIPPLTTEILLMFAIIGIALILFITEPLPIDIIAIAIMFTLIVLEPWTGVDAATGVGGFASSATVTVLAMFIISEGIQRTGLVNLIGNRIAERYGTSPYKQLLAVLGLSGGSAGFINNTPVVAVMIPMVNTLSKKTGISPSKLLMPVSYVAMLGGMLTLIGTSTNILASDISGRLIDHPFSMFEFTQLGVLVLLTGVIYFATFGRLLIPERIKISDELIEGFEMAEYLTEVVVGEESHLVGKTVSQCFTEIDVDAEFIQVIRGERVFTEPLARTEIRPGDILVLRTDQESLVTIIETEGLELAPDADVTDETLQGEEAGMDPNTEQQLVEIVISPGASILGETLETLNFRERYDSTVLAIRRGGEIIHTRMDERKLRGGDTLLIQGSEESIKRFANDRKFIIAQELTLSDFRYKRIPVALGIIGAVIGLAALGILPILVSALGGIVAMVATGCIKPNEVYSAVDWSVIVLLAGLIPLGVAMEETLAADWLAAVILVATAGLSPAIILGLFYLFTALITNVVSNNASVVLMIPVAIEAAQSIGADPFTFVLAVTFGASTAMLTPIGYQTNLMVYGPGGYKFSDFFRVGAPLQVILAVVTTLGLLFIWGV